MPEPTVSDITAFGLKGQLDRGVGLVLLDVREPWERVISAIPGTTTSHELHVPMASIPGRLDEIQEVSRGRSLVVYCHHGVRSLAAARWLAQRGLSNVFNLKGGIDAWSLEIDPAMPRY
jgi:rhodanese-related sulfurtransferase